MEAASSSGRSPRPATTATPTSPASSAPSPTATSTSSASATDHSPIRKELHCDPSSLIPVEIVSEEEMALIEAALASTRSLLSSTLAPALAACSRYSSSSRLLRFPGPLGPVRWKASSAPLVASNNGAALNDVEDGGGWVRPDTPMKKYRNRPLAVTLLTGMEWCEKQTEFSLSQGKPERTEAMRAGCDRHTQLEEEVIRRVNISTKSYEDYWAVNFLNFIVGANQLKLEGMTRELPVVGFVGGVCVTGIIDEIHLLNNGDISRPLLVDTKTRRKATLPSEAQKRNGRRTAVVGDRVRR